MRKFIIIFFFGCINFISAQAPSLKWANQEGGTGYDAGIDVITDALGNVYQTGDFSDTVDFDPGPGTFTMTSKGQKDVFVCKYNSVGNLIWAKQMGGASNDDESKAITLDSLGNIFIAGWFASTFADFDPGPGTYTFSAYGSGPADVFVVKLDMNGNFIWAKQMGGINVDCATGIAIGTGDKVYLSGYFYGTCDFDPGPGTYTLTVPPAFPNNPANPFVCKLDASGNFVWAKQFITTASAYSSGGCYAISLDTYDNVYTTGLFAVSVDFDPGPGSYVLTALGYGDSFISKLDAAGNFVWAKQFGGTGITDPKSIMVDAFNNIYTVGSFDYYSDFDPGSGTYTLTSFGSKDVFLSKLDANGNFIWANQIGGANDDQGKSVCSDAFGNAYICGYFNAVADFDPGPGTYTLISFGNDDIFISKLDKNGNFVWAEKFGGSSYDGENAPEEGNSITVDNWGNIYCTSYFYSMPADFDPGVGVDTLRALGWDDAVVFKLSPVCANPAAPINVTTSNNSNICLGAAATLSVTALGVVNWYTSVSSSTIINTGYGYITPVLAVGSYTYYVDATTCATSPSRTQITLNVYPNPTVTVSSSASVICTGQTATLNASGANTYTWSSGPTGNSIIINPTVTTNYTVIGADMNGCKNQSVLTQSVSSCTGINEIVSNYGLNVFPNPNDGEFNIRLISLEKNCSVEIYNVLGQIIFDKKLSELDTKINLVSQPNGIYFLRFIRESATISTQKIIKE